MIINTKSLKRVRKKHRNKKIVFASGVFDLFHVGHLYYLQRAKKLGDILVVNVVNDKRAKLLKRENRPIIGQKHRAKIIDSLKCVDYVVINPLVRKGVSLDTIEKLQPNIFLLNTLKKKERLKKVCPTIQPILNPETRITSTTKIIKRISSKYKLI